MPNCPHLTTLPLPHGTVHQVPVRVAHHPRIILVEDFPARYCPDCGDIFTDLGWDMAVQQAIERRMNQGETVTNVIPFADLQVTEPEALCI
ncbi:MAG: YgiT-type zinc finger protein [Ktedonobacterales bacterium]|nr:YgiT-type zinc finger protein [Ktedonobacterales bacterium]